MVTSERLADELAAACADAALDPASFAVFVVDARRPPGTTPIAYLQPGGLVRPDTVLVFQAVGARRAADRAASHRLALWRELPGLPAAALGPMIRHEVEHARRFERSGPRFFEADERLRAAFDRLGSAGYLRIPSEREANSAAAAYARARLAPAELAALAAHDDCRALLTEEQPPSLVVETTLEAIAALDGRDRLGDARERRAFVAEVAAACAAWPGEAPPDLTGGRSGPALELVSPLALA